MKLVFTKSNLNKAVGIVMKAVPTRTTMNILECILIDATTNEIKFTANDMELGKCNHLIFNNSRKVRKIISGFSCYIKLTFFTCNKCIIIRISS